ncbi:sensor domain-containing protein [Demequina sp. B12]|uniref:sensor histidine kinase n=1 Tax=Demequina sp. B12 TaxID=2992757 RepID=UPI00237AE962|nr:sensor histidine kinase [Demequina sp. B12]MDE0572512.1 sensor domain-containing protein [Demequina sp. B12]
MRALGRYFAATWSPVTWREVTYMLAGLPLGILWFTSMVTMYALGIGLLIVWVGVPILAVAQVSIRPIAGIERRFANTALCSQIEDPGPRRYRVHEPGEPPTFQTIKLWAHELLHDEVSWKNLAWIMARVVLGPVGFALAVCAIVVPVALVGAWLISFVVVLGIFPQNDPADAAVMDIVETTAFWTLVGTPVVLFAVPMFAWVNHYFGCLMSLFGRWSLGPREADRTAAATARAELAETQVRVDQELHDSIGHMITMNIIQAGAGAHVFDSDPEFARQALKNIEERGRAAMGELDRIIATIRGDDPQPRAPLPGIAQLPDLIASARAAGMEVDDRIGPADVPVALSRATYAVVREAVTNAARYAPGAQVTVRVEKVADALGVQVVNGPVEPGAAPLSRTRTGEAARGRGLAGIRDRVGLLGGVSRSGPTAQDGFEVLALIPVEMRLRPHPIADPDSPWASLRDKVTT